MSLVSQLNLLLKRKLIDTVNNILFFYESRYGHVHAIPAPLISCQNVQSRINEGDGAHEHPTQALLDSYSIREK
jgi:aspartate carbamoyltransferase catalytic subunit